MGILSGNIAEAMQKNYQNLIKSEEIAPAFTAFVDKQQSDKTALLKINIRGDKDGQTDESLAKKAARQAILDAEVEAARAAGTLEIIGSKTLHPSWEGKLINIDGDENGTMGGDINGVLGGNTIYGPITQLESIEAETAKLVAETKAKQAITAENLIKIEELAEKIAAEEVKTKLAEERLVEIQAKTFEAKKKEAKANAAEMMTEIRVEAEEVKQAEFIAQRKADEAAIQAEKEKQLVLAKKLAKLNAELLQSEINEEMSAAQTERFEKISKQIEEEKSDNVDDRTFELAKQKLDSIDEEKNDGEASAKFVNEGQKLSSKLEEEKGNEGEGDVRKQQVFKEKIIAGLEAEQKRSAIEKKANAEFQRLNDVSDKGLIDRAAKSGAGDKKSEIKSQVDSEQGFNAEIGDGDNWRKVNNGSNDGILSNTVQTGVEGGGTSQGDDGFGISSLSTKVTKTENKNAFREQMEANIKNVRSYNDRVTSLPEKSAIKDKAPSFADTRDGSLTGTDPFRFTTLAYPESITTDPQYGHFILFYVNVQNKTKYSYRGYNNDGDEIDVGDEYEKFVEDTSGGSQDHRTSATKQGGKFISSKGAREQFGLGDIEYQKQQHLEGKRGNHLRNNQVTLRKARKARAGINSVLDLTTRITDSVAIYLPSAVNDNVKAGYQDFNTGFAGFVALSGGKILNQIADNDFEGAAKSFIGKGGDILKDLGKRAAIGAYGGLLSGDGVMESFDKAFGQTVNPFIEVAFDSMGVRTFNYTFDFRPKSSRETKEVKAIIQLFRFHMVPELKGSNHRYLTLPSTFDIHYMYQTNEASKENEFYSKIATCVLTGCDVNYTPDGVKSFESGAPTHITMSLNFMETEMLTKEKINDGF